MTATKTKHVEHKLSISFSAPKVSDLKDLVDQLFSRGVPQDARITKIKRENGEYPYPSYLLVDVEWTERL